MPRSTVFDDIPLLAVDPAGEEQQEELKGGILGGHGGRMRRLLCQGNRAVEGEIEETRVAPDAS